MGADSHMLSMASIVSKYGIMALRNISSWLQTWELLAVEYVYLYVVPHMVSKVSMVSLVSMA